MINPIISSMMLIAVSALLLSVGSSQYVLAFTACCPDILLEEAAEAGNATTTSGISDQISRYSDTFLIVQHAQSGSIEQIPANTTDSFGTHILTLNNVSQAIQLSDRPNGNMSTVDNDQFVKDWYAVHNHVIAAIAALPPGAASPDPPNAALIIPGVNAGVIEFTNPKYDNNTQNIQYEIQALGNNTLDIPSQFDEVTFAIDECSDCLKSLATRS